eukprot:m.499544 g.499544  ORF g.499544 m.499544 type:complete len:236 (+) comp57324_c0_seq5:123-830(+)
MRLASLTAAPPPSSYLDLLPRDVLNMVRAPTPFPRDLSVAKTFELWPILWSFSLIVAKTRGAAFWRCKDSIVSLLIVLCAQVSAIVFSTRQGITSSIPATLMENVTSLLTTLRVAEWLPPPLCFLDEVISLIQPVCIPSALALSVRFVLEFPPIPTQYQPGAPSTKLGWHRRFPLSMQQLQLYLDPFKVILQSNIEKVGPLYPRLFAKQAVLQPPQQPPVAPQQQQRPRPPNQST